jgi:hypothetical protein
MEMSAAMWVMMGVMMGAMMGSMVFLGVRAVWRRMRGHDDDSSDGS